MIGQKRFWILLIYYSVTDSRQCFIAAACMQKSTSIDVLKLVKIVGKQCFQVKDEKMINSFVLNNSLYCWVVWTHYPGYLKNVTPQRAL